MDKLFIPRKNYMELDEVRNYLAIERWANRLQAAAAGGGGRDWGTVVVAAADTHEGHNAHFICDGSNDELTVLNAVFSLPNRRGQVVLLEGTYSFSAPVMLTDFDVAIRGMGPSASVITTGNLAFDINGGTVWISNLGFRGVPGSFGYPVGDGIRVGYQSRTWVVDCSFVEMDTALYGNPFPLNDLKRVFVARNYFYNVLAPISTLLYQSVIIGNIFEATVGFPSLVDVPPWSRASGNLFLNVRAYLHEQTQLIDNYFRVYYGATFNIPAIWLIGLLLMPENTGKQVVADNYVLIGSTTGAAIPPAIYVEQFCRQPTIWGNRLRIDTTGSPRVGIELYEPEDAIVVGNDIRGFTTPILFSGNPGTARLSWPNHPTWGDNFT
jgi:hypothetical protein